MFFYLKLNFFISSHSNSKLSSCKGKQLFSVSGESEQHTNLEILKKWRFQVVSRSWRLSRQYRKSIKMPRNLPLLDPALDSSPWIQQYSQLKDKNQAPSNYSASTPQNQMLVVDYLIWTHALSSNLLHKSKLAELDIFGCSRFTFVGHYLAPHFLKSITGRLSVVNTLE